MPSTARGNHPLCLLLLESSWLWRLPTVSSYLCDMSFFPFLSPATFYLSRCPLMSLAVTVLCVCVCMCTHTGTWPKNMARAVDIGANEQQYPSSWWELRGCRVVSVQPCAKMEGGCSTEERGLRGKEMQRLAEGGRKSCASGEKPEAGGSHAYFFICLRDKVPYWRYSGYEWSK